MEMSENTKFQNTAGSDILIAKSGFSNHAASNILDDLCFSKFGTFHGGCPNVERHRIRCPTRHGRNIRIFLQKLAAPVAFWNYIFSSILIAKRIPFKIQYRVAAPSAASHLNLHIRSDCSSAISRNPHTSHGYHTVPPSQARSLPWTDHSSRLQYRPVFSP